MQTQPSRSLDDALAVVFFAFALLVGASFWHDLTQPSAHPTTTEA